MTRQKSINPDLRSGEWSKDARRFQQDVCHWIYTNGIDADQLPPLARVILGIVALGSPVEPWAAAYLNHELVGLQDGIVA